MEDKYFSKMSHDIDMHEGTDINMTMDEDIRMQCLTLKNYDCSEFLAIMKVIVFCHCYVIYIIVYLFNTQKW